MSEKICTRYEVNFVRFDGETSRHDFDRMHVADWDSAVRTLSSLHQAYVQAFTTRGLPVPDYNYEFYIREVTEQLVDGGWELLRSDKVDGYDEIFAVEVYTDSHDICVLDEDPATGRVLYGFYCRAAHCPISCLVDEDGEEWFLNDWESDQPSTIAEFWALLCDDQCQNLQGIYDWAFENRALWKICDKIDRGSFNGYGRLLESVDTLGMAFGLYPLGRKHTDIYLLCRDTTIFPDAYADAIDHLYEVFEEFTDDCDLELLDLMDSITNGWDIHAVRHGTCCPRG